MLDTMKFQISGIAPLIMHNGQLADPSNVWSKALSKISRKRGKTEEDYAEMSRVEWFGSLYTHEGRIGITADVLLGFLLKAGKQFKLGPKVSAGLFETQEFYPLNYDGSKDPEKLFAAGTHIDKRGVKVTTSRVMRTRPIFRTWSLDFGVNVNTDIIDLDDVAKLVERGGEAVGLCDYRPRYGRFVTNRL
jgi:hypothetical protein